MDILDRPIISTIRICQVVGVDDDTDGERIRARLLPEDNKLNNNEIPYAFPLLPKMIHIKPKIGEAVLIICADANNGNTDRYYIGPIISQPQYQYKDEFNHSALSLLKGAIVSPSQAISTNPDTNGVLPKNDEIAIIGRKNSDIVLSDNDLRIRCGSRLVNDTDKTNITFNGKNSSFIKIKYHTTPLNNNNQSSATIVADEINLISNQSKDSFKLNDSNELINDEEMNNIINNAHVLPYGDKLVEFLKLFITAFKTHTHPYSGLPPCTDSTYQAVDNYNLNDILSKNVRIN